MTDKTGADYARTYRNKQREKLARYEAALREIEFGYFPDGEGMTWDDCAAVARNALK